VDHPQHGVGHDPGRLQRQVGGARHQGDGARVGALRQLPLVADPEPVVALGGDRLGAALVDVLVVLHHRRGGRAQGRLARQHDEGQAPGEGRQVGPLGVGGQVAGLGQVRFEEPRVGRLAAVVAPRRVGPQPPGRAGEAQQAELRRRGGPAQPREDGREEPVVDLRHVRRHRVHQHHPRHPVRAAAGVADQVQPGGAVAHQDVGGRRLAVLEQDVQVGGALLGGVGHQGGGAPAVARAVVAAGAGLPGDQGLHLGPMQGPLPQAAVQDHRRVARAGAVEVQGVAVHRHHAAGRRMAAGVPQGGEALVARAQARQDHARQQHGPHGAGGAPGPAVAPDGAPHAAGPPGRPAGAGGGEPHQGAAFRRSAGPFTGAGRPPGSPPRSAPGSAPR
jgi:hypothetical protein